MTRRCGLQRGRAAAAGGGDTVVLIDVAGLKEVNRAEGFLAGDAVILRVAARLERLSRAEAVVGRLGGDEFLVIFRGRHAAKAARFASALLRPGRGPAVRVATTAVRPRDTARTVIARLDAALRADRDRRRHDDGGDVADLSLRPHDGTATR